MTVNNKVACVFGGTGFVGRQVVRMLAKKGFIVKVATRVPERAYFLKPTGDVGQVVPFQCDAGDAESVARAVDGAHVVVNCIGILFEKGKKQRFQHVHVDVPAIIASACAKAGTGNFVHISALGIDKATSKYAKTKLEGEGAVRSNYPEATILRPSVIFGEDDSFFKIFAEIARYSPVLPLIGGGKTRLQPVYVADVAEAVMAALGRMEARGQTYELGGPDVVNFKEIYQRLFEHTGRKRCLVSIPFGLAKIEATFMSVLPRPPLTRDQVETLKTDSVVSKTAQGLGDLGVKSTSMDVVLPSYLESYRPGGRFAEIKNG